MRKLLPLLARSLPRIGRTFAIATMFLLHQRYFSPLTPLCAIETPQPAQSISEIQSQIVRIECNGDVVGYAFCFSEGLLVTACLDHSEPFNARKTYEFFLNDEKLSGSFRVVGSYENLSFIEYKLSDKIQPLPAQLPNEQPPVSQVQILQKREFLSIKNGYWVAEDSGYGIVDGRGEVGSLVVREGRAVGVVVQVGRESESGFLRIIQWKYLHKLLNYSQGQKLLLGISAKSCEEQQGIAVIRIAPNSPFHDSLQMGDIILRANNQKIRTPESLLKVCIMSSGPVQLTVLRDGGRVSVWGSV